MLSGPDITRKYQTICKRSFKTKLEQFLLSRCIADAGATDSFTMDEFDRYAISDEDIKMYAAVYYQQPYDHKIKGESIVDLYSIIESWKRLKAEEIAKWEGFYKVCFEKILSYEYFENFIKGDKCHYCHVTPEDINELIDMQKIFKKHETRGFSMEIDRKEPNKEYRKDNIVLCCYWCNNAKTDEFDDEDFKPIGKAIRKVWECRLGRKLKE